MEGEEGGQTAKEERMVGNRRREKLLFAKEAAWLQLSARVT